MEDATLRAAERKVLAALGELGRASMLQVANRSGVGYRTVRRIFEAFDPGGRVVRAGTTGRVNEILWRLPRPGEVLPLPEVEPDPPEAEIELYRKRQAAVLRVSREAWQDETHPLLGRDLQAYLERIDEAFELEGVA